MEDTETLPADHQFDVQVLVEPTCSLGMLPVRGNYCTNVKQQCKVWLDSPLIKERFRRCKEFEPAQCIGSKLSMSFCIDKYEHKELYSDLPMNMVDWYEAQAVCLSEDKRLCTDEEWTLACEGPDMFAHPYGNVRDSSKCYHDKLLKDLLDSHGDMKDLRLPIYTHPECVSPYGIQNMTGNSDEWVIYTHTSVDKQGAYKGGWWGAGLRSRCRPVTLGHSKHFRQIPSGFRCCSGLN